ncbi:alpha/beta hydrolase [Peptoanaerobacter stomatis]|uniref:alpha/beta hydrolase n=1 Tax=Peptoanaerobacter stomatis TaxID=796937 RepID=UPI003F9FB45D
MNIHYELDGKLKCFINPVLRSIGRRYRSAVIVCPGGGYSTLSEKEADLVALRYSAYGFQSFVLNYELGIFPKSAIDLIEAIKIIKKNSYIWDINPNQIIGCGFSAGGHLVASIGCIDEIDILKKYNNDIKLNGMILCYPVISSKGSICHRESIKNITDNNKDLISIVNLENKVGYNTPPTFIWHCIDDKDVNVQNTTKFLDSLSKYKIFYEAHIFSNGGHGLSLSDDTTAEIESEINDECKIWFDLSVKFIRKLRKL